MQSATSILIEAGFVLSLLSTVLLGTASAGFGVVYHENETAGRLAAVDGGSSIGDYNEDGFVSHADYSVLGDNFGSTTNLDADGNANGMVDIGDFDVYVDNYGTTDSLPSPLQLSISAAETVGGNVEWVLTFSGVSGALAGHMNIMTDGPDILSVVAGASFGDDGDGNVGVPGFQEGTLTDGKGGTAISFAGTTAYAALGTTLGLSPSNATLDFLTLVTEGKQTTMLTVLDGEVSGEQLSEIGYQGIDYTVGPLSHTFTAVPEANTVLIWTCLAMGTAGRTLCVRRRGV